jgi:hypothetical protein
VRRLFLGNTVGYTSFLEERSFYMLHNIGKVKVVKIHGAV